MISAPGHTQGVGPSVPSLSTKEIKPPNNWNKNETHEKLAKLLWLRSCGDTGLKCRLLRKLWQDDLQVQGLPGLHPTRTPAGLKVSKTDSFCTSFLCVQGNNLIHNSNRIKNKQKRPSYLESNVYQPYVKILMLLSGLNKWRNIILLLAQKTLNPKQTFEGIWQKIWRAHLKDEMLMFYKRKEATACNMALEYKDYCYLKVQKEIHPSHAMSLVVSPENTRFHNHLPVFLSRQDFSV